MSGERVFRRRIRGKASVVWYAWIAKPGGGVKRVSTNCTDKVAATARAAELERASVDPHHAAANQASTESILSGYLASRQRLGRSAGTLHHVRIKSGHLRRLLPKRAADIDHPQVEHYADERLKEGAARTTVKKELRILKAALRHATRNKLFEGDPHAVIPEFEDGYVPRTRFLTPWELVALIAALGESDVRSAMVVFIVATSARWGEAKRAQRSDVVERGGRTFVRLRGTKTKKSAREVPMLGAAATLLAWSLERAHTEDHLFPSWGNVRRDLYTACARAGMAPCSPNDLRRTFATWLQQAGVGNDLTAQMMGHTDSRMIELVYGRRSPDDVARLVEERTRLPALTAHPVAPTTEPAPASPEAGAFPLNAARAALTDLALEAGITVTP